MTSGIFYADPETKDSGSAFFYLLKFVYFYCIFNKIVYLAVPDLSCCMQLSSLVVVVAHGTFSCGMWDLVP